METILIVVGVLLLLIGFLGSVVPGIPGPPLAYVALLVLLFVDRAAAEMQSNSYLWLISFGLVTVFITVVDYYMPIWGTKKFGGTRAGSRGSTIGLIIGLLLSIIIPGIGILALLLGPAVGAYIGERNAGQEDRIALQSAKGSFLGFIAGTLMKVVVVSLIAVYFVRLLF